MKIKFLDRFSKNTWNTSFNKIPSTMSQFVPCERIDRQTNMAKLLVVFRNFVEEPKSWEKDTFYVHFF
jgi:hypothetical protein